YTAIANAGYSSGQRPPQRTLVLTLSPPLDGNHQGPPVSGVTAMSASYYEQGDQTGVAATTSSFDVTTTTSCVTGPLTLTFPTDGGVSGTLTGQISVPFCNADGGSNGNHDAGPADGGP